MKRISLLARSALALVGLAAALLSLCSASAPAQTISPMDGTPAVTSRAVQRIAPPLDLYNLTVDWSALGFSATDLANVGPTAQSLVDPPSSSGNLVVGNNPATCPNAQYSTIQSAVIAASPGAHIVVCSGTYVEQVVIPAGKDNLTLQSKKPLAALIQAPAVMTSPKAIVQVQAKNADIQQFTIQGPGGFGCDSLEYGVRVDSSGSATIEHNHITHIRDNPFSGCQNGVGVQVGRFADGTTGSATIRNNQIDDYQKNGITISNTGSSGDVENNIVQGAGPTAVIAQNGIQISSGATAQLKNNTVSGNVYTPGFFTSTGILLFAPGSTDVENNRLNADDTAIYAYQSGSTSTVNNNAVVGSTYDGITVDTSSAVGIHNNRSLNNDQGIGVYTTTSTMLDNNQAKDNRSNGFFAFSDTSGNTFQNDHASGSTLFDCRDDSTGTGTAGTANFWLTDTGATSSPPGICQ